MEFGAVLPHNEVGTDPEALKTYVQGVEALGATHVLLYDHVLGADPDRPGGFEGAYDKNAAFHEPFTTFAFVAAVTTRLQMMTAVLILPQRQTVLVAKQAAELANLSNGRFRLGVGTGWNEVEYVGLDVPFAARGRRQAEQVELLRSLWDEDSLNYTGEFHHIDRAGINPRPQRPIDVWFGGSAPALLDRCARLGDGWIPLMGPNASAAAALETLRSKREESGRSWDGFGIQAQAQYAGGNPDRWARHADKWRELGATHLAIATHNAGPASAQGHVDRVAEYLRAVTG